jgi:hypothetical protein
MALDSLSGPRPPLWGSSITLRHNKFSRTLWTSNQPDLYLTTHTHSHSQETDIHTPGGIRNRNRSKQESVDPRLRPHEHRNRLFHNRSVTYARNLAIQGAAVLPRIRDTAVMKSGTGHQLQWLTDCVVYMCPSKQISGQHLKRSCERFSPHTFQFST